MVIASDDRLRRRGRTTAVPKKTRCKTVSDSETLNDLFERGVRPFLAPPGRTAPLPALPARFHGFADVYSVTIECRLGAQAGPVDFAWSQFREDFSVPPALAHEEPWTSMARFGECGQAGRSALPPIPSVVYEIDQDGERFGEVPAIFFNRIKGNASSVAAIYRSTNALLARPSSPGTETMLRRVVDQMPPGSVVLCIGYMLSRPTAPVRFEMTQIEPYRSLPTYLRAIGWPGDEARVKAVLDSLPHLTRDFHAGLAFDVADSVGPRLGLEFVFKDYTDHKAALAGALDDLIAAGLCTPGWREALARWTGDGPSQPDWMRALLPDDSRHRRIVSHFKIVLDGPHLQATGYVECVPLRMLDPTRWNRPARRPLVMTEG